MSDGPTAVVFDVGRVLYRWDMRCLFEKLVDDPDELDWVLANVVTERWHFEHDAGRDLDELTAARKESFPEHAHLIDAYATRFAETIPGPVPGTHDLVRRLADRSVPLYAITNFAAPFWAEFRAREALFGNFEDIVVSGIEKLAKPDPAIYQLAAQRFGRVPDDMLFIDDSLANVEAARMLGWHVHHFTDAPALESELAERGLL